MTSVANTPVRIDETDVQTDRWPDAARGTIQWKTLISGDVTPTDTLICGIAIMGEGDTFASHSHPEPEIYFGLEGDVTVQINGIDHALKPGVALFIPGGATHGVARAHQKTRWFYTFAADAFPDITYSFV